MDLKAACKTAAVLVLLSIPLTMIGYASIYLPMMRHGFHLAIIINALLAILAFLLQAGGFLIFLLAFTKQLKDPSPNTAAFVPAGILILLGTIIAAATSLMHENAMYQHFDILRFALYVSSNGFAFLAGLCLSIFIFTQTGKASTAKILASLALGTSLIYSGLTITNIIVHSSNFFKGPGLLHCIGYAIWCFGYFANLAAILTFLFAFLTAPKENIIADPAKHFNEN